MSEPLQLTASDPAQVIVYVDGKAYWYAQHDGSHASPDSRERRLIVAMLETALEEARK